MLPHLGVRAARRPAARLAQRAAALAVAHLGALGVAVVLLSSKWARRRPRR